MSRAHKKRGWRRRNRGWFKRGHDPRRHQLTFEDRRKGGLTTARRYLCTGQWHLDWLDRCDRKIRSKDGDFIDGPQENDRNGSGEPGSHHDDIPF